MDKFIEFYNKLEMKKIQNKDELFLSNDNPLNDFFIHEDNKFGKTYKIIYKYFIKLQNEKVEKLLDKKILKGVFDSNCKIKVNVQQINEKEIFKLNLDEKISFIDILFNSSYRKILDISPIRYNSYREYVINYDFLESVLTDLLLRNKKLLNDNIIEFIYNNELFNNQINNLITSFKKRYKCKNLIISDKISIYKFCIGNKNIHLYKEIIIDFIELFKFLNNNRKENKDYKGDYIKEEEKLINIVPNIKDVTSENFKKLFEGQDGLTVDKTSEIFEYYLKVIFDDIKVEIKKYQNKLDENSKESINKYNEKEKKHIINKKDFAYAIRLFVSLVLLFEENKENKIKYNNNNIINYLKSEDLWKKEIYNNDKFDGNLNEFKLMNFHIDQIIPLYEELGKDIEDNFFDDVKRQIKNEEPDEEEEVEEEENERKSSHEEEEEESENQNDNQNVQERY